jgi:hypothetical protein
MTETTDYKIIIIDSKNVIYNDADTYDFYINLQDPIRDVYKIKVLYDAVSIPTINIKDTDLTTNLDLIYIQLNDYDRIRTSLINPLNNVINNLTYFDEIMIDVNRIKSTVGINETTMFNDYNDKEGDYYLNPIAAQLYKLNLKLHDKNNNIISKTYISRFIMKLCVYYNTKKLSQF